MALTATAMRSAPRPERWEHMRLRMSSNDAENEASLNDLGAEGWQLVQVMPLHYWLKRRLA